MKGVSIVEMELYLKPFWSPQINPTKDRINIEFFYLKNFKSSFYCPSPIRNYIGVKLDHLISTELKYVWKNAIDRISKFSILIIDTNSFFNVFGQKWPNNFQGCVYDYGVVHHVKPEVLKWQTLQLFQPHHDVLRCEPFDGLPRQIRYVQKNAKSSFWITVE